MRIEIDPAIPLRLNASFSSNARTRIRARSARAARMPRKPRESRLSRLRRRDASAPCAHRCRYGSKRMRMRAATENQRLLRQRTSGAKTRCKASRRIRQAIRQCAASRVATRAPVAAMRCERSKTTGIHHVSCVRRVFSNAMTVASTPDFAKSPVGTRKAVRRLRTYFCKAF